MNTDVTVVLTSCGRQDLLEWTIDSFLKFNTHPIARFFITEDSGVLDINAGLKKKYSALPIVWIEREKRGKFACIDEAYSRVRTPFIFHCEDDWEFYASGFIERSKAILEARPEVLQVWIRPEGDDGQPVEPEVYCVSGEAGEEIRFKRLPYDVDGVWNGFSLNPGLRRLADYQRLGSYAPLKGEPAISIAYKLLEYRAVILCGAGYVRHTGHGRHVVDPELTTVIGDRLIHGMAAGVDAQELLRRSWDGHLAIDPALAVPLWRRCLRSARFLHPRLYARVKHLLNRAPKSVS